MKRSYTPCEKHELIGCITCSRPQVSTWFYRVGALNNQQAVLDLLCPRCDGEFELTDRIALNQGVYYHQYCWTDLGDKNFQTYENSLTQHSHHDIDKTIDRIYPSPLDRGWEKEDQE